MNEVITLIISIAVFVSVVIIAFKKILKSVNDMDEEVEALIRDTRNELKASLSDLESSSWIIFDDDKAPLSIEVSLRSGDTYTETAKAGDIHVDEDGLLITHDDSDKACVYYADAIARINIRPLEDSP